MKYSLAILFSLAFLVIAFGLVSIAFDHSLHTFRFAGFAFLFFIGMATTIYGYKETKTVQNGKVFVWYKQRLIVLGLLVTLSAFFSFCLFVLSILLSK